MHRNVAEPNRCPIYSDRSDTPSLLHVRMRALMVGRVMALLCVLSWDHPNPRRENSKQDAAKNTIDDATQMILKTSQLPTPRSVQAYKRQCTLVTTTMTRQTGRASS